LRRLRAWEVLVRERRSFVSRKKAGDDRAGSPKITLRDPVAALRQNRTLAKAIVRFSLLCHAAVLLSLGVLYLPDGALRWLEIAGYSSLTLAFLFVLFLSNLGLCRTAGAAVLELRTANKLTLLRFALVAPIVLIIADAHLVAGLVLYGVSGITDMADGYIARRRGQETRFGVMMDPIADILTTAGVFGVLYARELVPWWVVAVLVARYASLGLGSLLLTLFVGPIEFKSTITGKIVGVLQAAAVILILALTAAGVQWKDRLGAYLFPFIALIFASVIVSKLVIAVRHIRGGPAHVGSQGRSRRLSTDLGDADAQPRRRDG
jgi:cardiolipin synthase